MHLLLNATYGATDGQNVMRSRAGSQPDLAPRTAIYSCTGLHLLSFSRQSNSLEPRAHAPNSCITNIMARCSRSIHPCMHALELVCVRALRRNTFFSTQSNRQHAVISAQQKLHRKVLERDTPNPQNRLQNASP